MELSAWCPCGRNIWGYKSLNPPPPMPSLQLTPPQDRKEEASGQMLQCSPNPSRQGLRWLGCWSSCLWSFLGVSRHIVSETRTTSIFRVGAMIRINQQNTSIISSLANQLAACSLLAPPKRQQNCNGLHSITVRETVPSTAVPVCTPPAKQECWSDAMRHRTTIVRWRDAMRHRTIRERWSDAMRHRTTIIRWRDAMRHRTTRVRWRDAMRHRRSKVLERRYEAPHNKSKLERRCEAP
jgi:hypothetical protein